MARHFAPTKIISIALPELKLPQLPKLFKKKKRRVHKIRYERAFTMQEMYLMLASTLLFILGILLPLGDVFELVTLALSALVALFPLLAGILQRFLDRKLPNEDLLAVVAVVLAFCIGESISGAIAAILFRLAQILEAYAQTRGEATLEERNIALPTKAVVETEAGNREMLPEMVPVGSVILVAPGETIPLDGTILEGSATIDLSPLTGVESTVKRSAGECVFSGTIDRGGPLRIRVDREFSDSAETALLREIESAARYQTLQERLTDRISAYCVPVIGCIALCLGLLPPIFTGEWVRWLRIAVLFLLLASPSALAISIPLACLGAEMSGVRQGILSKGHDCFEVLARTKTMVFGKTGTITEGDYSISGVFPNGVRDEDLLSVAAAAESYSHHPIAAMLKKAAGWTPEVADGVMEVEEIPSRGVSAFIEGRHVYVGNAALLRDHDVPFKVPTRSGAAIHVAVENRYWGHILVTDKTREGAFDALEALRSQGVDQMVLLTGDVLSASRALASSLGFDLMRPELTTEGKVSTIDYLIDSNGRNSSVAFIGDGINDAPMLEHADVGIAVDALDAWNEAESADILILANELELLPETMRIARGLRLILWEDFCGLLGVKLLLLILALTTSIPIALAMVISTVFTALALFNALRAFGL